MFLLNGILDYENLKNNFEEIFMSKSITSACFNKYDRFNVKGLG